MGSTILTKQGETPKSSVTIISDILSVSTGQDVPGWPGIPG